MPFLPRFDYFRIVTYESQPFEILLSLDHCLGECHGDWQIFKICYSLPASRSTSWLTASVNSNRNSRRALCHKVRHMLEPLAAAVSSNQV